MGACCGGMKSGQNKSLPENEKANNVDEKEQCANGPQGDAAVVKETLDTADQQQQTASDHEASVNHSDEHRQPATVTPDDVELKIREPDRPEPVAAPAACPVADKPDVCPVVDRQATDEGAVKDQSKPSTGELFVSEDGEVTRPQNEVSTTETGPSVEMSYTMQVTEVHTTTVDGTPTTTDVAYTVVQKDEKLQEVGTIGDVEQLKQIDDLVVPTDADISQTSTPVVVEQTSSVEANREPAILTAGSEDHQIPADTDVVLEETSVAEAATAVDQLESSLPPPPPAASEQQEVGKVDDLEHLKSGDDLIAPPDSDMLQISSSVVVEQTTSSVEAPAVTDEPHHESAGIEDHQEHSDTGVTMETSAGDVVVATSAVESALPPPPSASELAEQLPDDTVHSHETVSAVDTAPTTSDHLDADQPSPVTSESVDAPAVTASLEGTMSQEPVLQQHPATDNVEATTEQTLFNVEAPSTAVDTPPSVDVSAEVTAVDHEEPHAAAEETEQSRDVEVTNVSNTESAAGPVVDESVSKPEDAADSSVARDEVGEIQPEELPPPPTPEKEDTTAPGSDEIQQDGSTERQEQVEQEQVESPSESSEQPAVNGCIETVEEPTSKSASEAVAGEVPVTGEP